MQVELIQPAVKGTLNVLGSCAKAKSVKRVVLTSSIATMAYKKHTQTTNVVVDETWFSDPVFAEEIKVNFYLFKSFVESHSLAFLRDSFYSNFDIFFFSEKNILNLCLF